LSLLGRRRDMRWWTRQLVVSTTITTKSVWSRYFSHCRYNNSGLLVVSTNNNYSELGWRRYGSWPQRIASVNGIDELVKNKNLVREYYQRTSLNVSLLFDEPLNGSSLSWEDDDDDSSSSGSSGSESDDSFDSSSEEDSSDDEYYSYDEDISDYDSEEEVDDVFSEEDTDSEEEGSSDSDEV